MLENLHVFPQVGDYFGIITDRIHYLYPAPGAKICMGNRKVEQVALLFKRVSEAKAIEITSGVEFMFEPYLEPSFNDILNLNNQSSKLIIGRSYDDIIQLDDADLFKTLYAYNVDLKETLLACVEHANEIFQSELSDLVDKDYGIASTENAIYDFERKLSLNNQNN